MPSRSPSTQPKVQSMLKSNPWQPGLVHTLYNCGHAARPWSFTASYFPMLLTALSLTTVPETAAVAWEGQESSFLLKFVLVLVGGIGVHAGANLTNTYYDYYKKVDADSSADDRTILDGILAPQTVFLLATCCYAASAAAWAMLVQQLGMLLYVVSGGAFLGWAYTATPFGLKYKAVGEIVVFLCFGPLLALATGLSLGAPLEALQLPLLLSLSPALLACAILHANNARDIAADRSAGADTLAQRLGSDGCRRLYGLLLTLPYCTAALPVVLTGEPFLQGAAAWGYKPPLFCLLTIPLATDLFRAYQRGELSELPQQTAQFHALFCGAMAVSMLSTAALARVMLGLLFVMGGGNNFYDWTATLAMIRNRLELALPIKLPHFLPPILLATASIWQICAALVFISGYGGPEVTRNAATLLVAFLLPVTFIVHDFWAATKYSNGLRPNRAQWSAAGCVHGGQAPPTPVPTFGTDQDSEFIHFFKNVCILGGLTAYLAGCP